MIERVFPKVGCALVLRSAQNINLEVYDCLKSIQCDKTRTRRACEGTHTLYDLDDDGRLSVWKGTEYIIEFFPSSCTSLKKAMDVVFRNTELYLAMIRQMKNRYQLRVALIFSIVMDKENEYPYPEMTITRKMMGYINAIGAEIQIVMEEAD